jgi:hypothetical protein
MRGRRGEGEEEDDAVGLTDRAHRQLLTLLGENIHGYVSSVVSSCM